MKVLTLSNQNKALQEPTMWLVFKSHLKNQKGQLQMAVFWNPGFSLNNYFLLRPEKNPQIYTYLYAYVSSSDEWVLQNTGPEFPYLLTHTQCLETEYTMAAQLIN